MFIAAVIFAVISLALSLWVAFATGRRQAIRNFGRFLDEEFDRGKFIGAVSRVMTPAESQKIRAGKKSPSHQVKVMA
jgi:hypothetical protein